MGSIISFNAANRAIVVARLEKTRFELTVREVGRKEENPLCKIVNVNDAVAFLVEAEGF